MYSKQLHQGLCFDASVSAAIERTSRLSPALESALILRAQQGDHEARQRIISANLAWISAVGGSSSGRGLEDDELLSAGVIGLNEAIDHWKPEQQTNIRTYGQFWIRKFQSESLFETDTIRIPKSTHEQLAKLRKAHRVLGDEATISELAEYTQLREKRILELQSISQPTSLNVCVGAEGHTELLDLQADVSCECSDLPLSPELQNLIQRLDPRQQEVIRLRFLEGWTFKDIGEFFSLTSQRIQQICKAALEKLKGWLVGEGVESAPVPQRWQQYVFAKVLLATQFYRKCLKHKVLKSFKRFLIPLPLPSRPLEKDPDFEHESSSQPTFPQTISPEATLNPPPLESRGLRDGSKRFLNSCWCGLLGVARHLENWPGVPRGREQHRCRGGTKVLFQKKKVRLKVFPTLPVGQLYSIETKKFKPKIEYFNSIRPFLRNSIFLV